MFDSRLAAFGPAVRTVSSAISAIGAAVVTDDSRCSEVCCRRGGRIDDDDVSTVNDNVVALSNGSALVDILVQHHVVDHDFAPAVSDNELAGDGLAAISALSCVRSVWSTGLLLRIDSTIGPLRSWVCTISAFRSPVVADNRWSCAVHLGGRGRGTGDDDDGASDNVDLTARDFSAHDNSAFDNVDVCRSVLDHDDAGTGNDHDRAVSAVRAVCPLVAVGSGGVLRAVHPTVRAFRAAICPVRAVGSSVVADHGWLAEVCRCSCARGHDNDDESVDDGPQPVDHNFGSIHRHDYDDDLDTDDFDDRADAHHNVHDLPINDHLVVVQHDDDVSKCDLHHVPTNDDDANAPAADNDHDGSTVGSSSAVLFPAVDSFAPAIGAAERTVSSKLDDDLGVDDAYECSFDEFDFDFDFDFDDSRAADDHNVDDGRADHHDNVDDRAVAHDYNVDDHGDDRAAYDDHHGQERDNNHHHKVAVGNRDDPPVRRRLMP